MAVAHVGVTWGVQRLSRGTMSLTPAQVSLVGPPTITCHQVMAIVSPTRPRGFVKLLRLRRLSGERVLLPAPPRP